MAEPKQITTLTGEPVDAAEVAEANPQTPLNLFTLAAAVIQLQHGLAALQHQFNVLAEATTHSEDKVSAASPQATGLFPES